MCVEGTATKQVGERKEGWGLIAKSLREGWGQRTQHKQTLLICSSLMDAMSSITTEGIKVE